MALALPTLALASGCSKLDEWQHPEIAACRSFVTGGLRSPSTYKEVSVDRGDEANGHIKSVSIHYDAANAYGTPIRGAQKCDFGFDPKKATFLREPKLAATLASADRALGVSGTSACCLPKPAAKETELMPGDLMENVSGSMNIEGAQ